MTTAFEDFWDAAIEPFMSGSAKLYAIMDGAEFPDLIDWAAAYGAAPVSLCRGGQPPEVIAASPFLVPIEKDGDLHGWFRARALEHPYGMLALTSASIGEVRRHLGALGRVGLPDGRRVNFRWYDSRVLGGLFPLCDAIQKDTILGPLDMFLVGGRATETVSHFHRDADPDAVASVDSPRRSNTPLSLRFDQVQSLVDIMVGHFAGLMSQNLCREFPSLVAARFGDDRAALVEFIVTTISEAANRGINARPDIRRYLEAALDPSGKTVYEPSPVKGIIPMRQTSFNDPVQFIPRPTLECHLLDPVAPRGCAVRIDIEAAGLAIGAPVIIHLIRAGEMSPAIIFEGEIAGRKTSFEIPLADHPDIAEQDIFIVEAMAGLLRVRTNDLLVVGN